VTFKGDPHRVLGVPQGASIAEVKRAYRLLAKRNHPDAGEGSLARFLEIQAAYEVLARRDAAGGIRAGAARTPGRRPAQQGPRTGGSRRGSGERADDPGVPPPPGTEWARRPREDGGRTATGAGRAGPTADAGHAARNPGGNPRTATLGSTTYGEAGTYDEAGRAAEPAWQGADWYGPVSGTYWTLNPKEYADPRKHGPEYLARSSSARVRDAHGRLPLDHENLGAPYASKPTSPNAGARTAPPRTTVTRARDGTGVRQTAWPGPVERLVVGGLGWLPFGMLLAAAAGLPGGLIATLPIQAVGLVGMLRAPRLAWASAGGLVAVIVCAIPFVGALAALGVAVRPGAPAPVTLVVLAAFAWCAGAAVASSGRLIGRPWRAGP